jgi:hypothetical protein
MKKIADAKFLMFDKKNFNISIENSDSYLWNIIFIIGNFGISPLGKRYILNDEYNILEKLVYIVFNSKNNHLIYISLHQGKKKLLK